MSSYEQPIINGLDVASTSLANVLWQRFEAEGLQDELGIVSEIVESPLDMSSSVKYLLPFITEIRGEDPYLERLLKDRICTFAETFAENFPDVFEQEEDLPLREFQDRRDEISKEMLGIFKQAVERSGEEMSPRLSAVLTGKAADLEIAQSVTYESGPSDFWKFFRLDVRKKRPGYSLEEKIKSATDQFHMTYLRSILYPGEVVNKVMSMLGRTTLSLLSSETVKVLADSHSIGRGDFIAEDKLTKEDFDLLAKNLSDEEAVRLVNLVVEQESITERLDEGFYDKPHRSAISYDYQIKLIKEDLTLRWVHAQRIINAIDAAIQTRTYGFGLDDLVPDYLDEIGNVDLTDRSIEQSELIEQLEQIAYKWYEVLILPESLTPLADRRIPRADISGFEAFMLNPSNYEVGEILSRNLPDGITLEDIKSVRYLDIPLPSAYPTIPERKEDFSFVEGYCFSGSSIVIVQSTRFIGNGTPQELMQQRASRIEETLRHEAAHVWMSRMRRVYPQLDEMFDHFVRYDIENAGDIFSKKLSNYDVKSLFRKIFVKYPTPTFDIDIVMDLLKEQYVEEIVSELWCLSANPDFENRLKKAGLKGELEMLRCIRDQEYLDAQIGEWNQKMLPEPSSMEVN